MFSISAVCSCESLCSFLIFFDSLADFFLINIHFYVLRLCRFLLPNEIEGEVLEGNLPWKQIKRPIHRQKCLCLGLSMLCLQSGVLFDSYAFFVTPMQNNGEMHYRTRIIIFSCFCRRKACRRGTRGIRSDILWLCQDGICVGEKGICNSLFRRILQKNIRTC